MPRGLMMVKFASVIGHLFWKKLGLNIEEAYQMRLTYASELVASEEPIMWIAKQMGHRDPSVLFDRYARWVPEMYQGVGRKISKSWS